MYQRSILNEITEVEEEVVEEAEDVVVEEDVVAEEAEDAVVEEEEE